MAEALRRTEPVPASPVEFVGARVALEPPMARYSLRAREADLLDRVIGGGLPRAIGSTSDGIICLGPDEWLMRVPMGTAAPGRPGEAVSVVDVSERQVAIAVEGARAVEVLRGGNPLDLENFPVGSGKRTIFEGVEIVLIRESETRFVVEVWRSFAEFVWGVLVKSASEL
ncbi:sarcosine oxidase subunit gamma family protein [Altererythrobacter arenosus]|uniref:Sarcosine oxidase subunit gamma family protein n=1 Tax=Altererythrobacter arenosus TaxID=3032592 RepID=A0ABY8FZC1_9SPHN|nr:sarcosine oxidase subunit gamma family protein [Altererythrobacter sp. CAU 1644]WFL77344.1 sarcosine oxidase subunit gamma family protein [Altererythrobacter sp. CAU 1644]